MKWAGVARGRWRLAWNTVFRERRATGKPRRELWAVVLAVLLGAMVCVGLAAMFGQLAAAGATAREAGGALGLVLTAALIGLLVFDLHEVVATLIADSDLELLRRAPISRLVLFGLKLADALPRTSLLLVVLAIPAVVAYHAFYPLPVWAWLALPFQLVTLWLIPLSIGIAASTLLLTLVPARRASEALGLISTFTLFVLWLINSFLLPRLAASEGDPVAHLRSLARVPSIMRDLSPGNWVARAMAAAASGAVGESIAAFAWLCAATTLTLGLAAWAASRLLEVAQSRIAAGAGTAAARRQARVQSERRPRARRSMMVALLSRDAKLVRRDWPVLGEVLTTAVLWTLLPVVGAPLFATTPPRLARAMLILLTVGLGYDVAARAIPFERRGLAWARLAPVGAGRWIAAKVLGIALISVPLVALAAGSLVLTLNLSGGDILEILCLVLPALGLSLCVGTWVGSLFGRTDWTSPRAMLSLGGRVLATALLLGQAGVWLLIAELCDAAHDGLGMGGWARALGGVNLWGPAVAAALISIWPLRQAAALLARRDFSA